MAPPKPRKEIELLKHHISRNRMKLTRQREIILEAFLESERHATAEDIYRRIARRNPGIGLATVYRTLNLLCHSGLAQQSEFGDGRLRFENMFEHHHHDHLICTGCGRIIEFQNEEIERLQEKVAERNRFTIHSHRLDLYGLCNRCGG